MYHVPHPLQRESYLWKSFSRAGVLTKVHLISPRKDSDTICPHLNFYLLNNVYLVT